MFVPFVDPALAPRRLILYGSLRRTEPSFARLDLAAALAYLRPITFPGSLYDLGDYPAAVPGAGQVHGELHRLRDPTIIATLDAFELCRPADPRPYDFRTGQGSLYRRQTIIAAGAPAWIYLYNGQRPRRRHPRPIPHGDWLRHLRQRGRSPAP